MRKFTADFETNVDEKDCRVWAWAVCEIGNVDIFKYGNSLESFIEWCANKKYNYVLYFHNLKFDGEYIFNYLLKNGYELITDKKLKRDKTFTCLISGMGQFYSIEIFFTVGNHRVNKVTIYDSLKILNMSVEVIAKQFDLPIRKLEIDYKEFREVGHELTEQEVDYIRNDVEIMSRALKIMFDLGLTKMTIGSNALHNYRSMIDNFNKFYPELPLELDTDMRKSYKGGFTYLSPVYKEKEVGKGIVLDVNSLYPSVMKNCYLPFGQPIYFEGKYKYSFLYPLYIQRISCSFELKEGKIPTIQIKNNVSFNPTEYLTSSNGDIITLTLTNIDLKLFLENYNVRDLLYDGGWKFKQTRNLFDNYVNIWSNNKIQAKKDGNKALYMVSKLMLNSLYGKFAKNPYNRSKYPYINENGEVSYYLGDKEIGKGLYIPIGAFITSYAREKTIRTSQAIRDYTLSKYGKDYYIYSDTDSIHMLELPEEELKTFVDIDDYILGYWKLESKFKKGKFIRQKCYIEQDYDDKINVTVAGLPKRLGKYITFENFKTGFSLLASDTTIDHKLTYKHVDGGVMLVETDFTIK